MDAIIVGGGAAGFFAAIELKRRQPSWQVLLLEAAARPLAKVRISGGGRCNLTHACFEVGRLVQNYPRGEKQLRSLFSRFGPAETMRWFEQRGVDLKVEEDGRVFPVSDSSQSIIDCLQGEAARLGVEVRVNSRVLKIEPGWVVHLRQQVLKAPRLLLATGGAPNVYEWLEGLGHAMISPCPSLFTFTIEDDRLRDLPGISVERVRAVLETKPPLRQEGALLITHWGLSGPVTLRLSAWGARMLQQLGYQAWVRVDWLPDVSQEEVRSMFEQRRAGSNKKIAGDCPWGLPKRLWRNLVADECVWSRASDKMLNRLLESLKNCRLKIVAKGVFKEEFVVAGGVPLSEIELKTMQSKLLPGLYLAGELLDVDGVTGGFNFQNAWASGYVAAAAMAESTA
ncbi:NAD(P)/FAD-dependent oxidoreductase [bacterium]|nr:NAD(P)/FAD-dependent oxidoreductase [bacterium]